MGEVHALVSLPQDPLNLSPRSSNHPLRQLCDGTVRSTSLD